MDNVYVVISMTWGLDLEACEVYEELQAALGKAVALTHFASVHHPEWMKDTKVLGSEADGNRRWIFLNNSSNYIAVHQKSVQETNKPVLGVVSPPLPASLFDVSKNTDQKKIIDNNSTHLTIDDLRAIVFENKSYTNRYNWAEDHCKSCKICQRMVVDERKENPLLNIEKEIESADTLIQAASVIDSIMPPLIAPIQDDPMDCLLPGGWDFNGKPITMGDLLSDPHNVVPFYNLRENQKFALVFARINKRPNFTCFILGLGNCDQTYALNALKNKTSVGNEIVLMEIDWLDRALNEQKLQEDEELSSSSSEDY